MTDMWMSEDEVAGEDAFTCSILCVIWAATNKKAPEGEQMEDPVRESIIYRSQNFASMKLEQTCHLYIHSPAGGNGLSHAH